MVLDSGTSVTASKEAATGDELAAIVWDLGQATAGEESRIFSRYSHAFFAVPFLIILAAETAFRIRRYRERNSRRIKSDRAFKTAVKELKALKNGAKRDVKELYEQIEGILAGYMSDRFSINIRGGGDIRKEMIQSGVDEETVNRLLTEIDAFSFIRFAPTRQQEVDIAGTLVRVEKILRDLEKRREKTLKSKECSAKSLPAIFLVFMIVSFPHVSLSAAVPEQSGINELFFDANRAYTNGDYETALKIYGKLRNDFRIESPALLFNIANANFRTGRLGEAILLYKRILKTSTDADLNRAAKKNLETARETLRLREEEKEGTVKYMATDYRDGTFLVFSIIPYNVSLIIALIACTAFSVVFAIFRLKGSSDGIIRILFATLLVFTVSSAANLLGSAYVMENYHLGIVTEKEARIYDGKTLKATSIPAPEGLEVRILSGEGDFYYIELTGGQRGYIPKEALGKI